MAQPPSPHAITGSLSRRGNALRSSGRKTTWPGEPGAGSEMTLYGPGIAFGAPSSGSVVRTKSALGPGPWAKETHAVRTNAAVSADFMRGSLADGERPPYTVIVTRYRCANRRPSRAMRVSAWRLDCADQRLATRTTREEHDDGRTRQPQHSLHGGDRNEHLPTVHGFNEFFGISIIWFLEHIP